MRTRAAWRIRAAALASTAALVGWGGLPSPASALPDGRGYELVSPSDNNGGDVMPQGTRTRSSVSGDAVGFASLIGFGDVMGTGVTTEYISKRTAAPRTRGWATHGIVPKVDPLSLNAAVLSLDTFYPWEFSDDLSIGILRTFTNFTGDPNLARVSNTYRRSDLLTPGPGTYELVSACPACVAPPNLNGNPEIADATSDFGQIIFESRQNLVAGVTGNTPKLYEWDHGTLRLAGVLPDDNPARCASFGTPICSFAGAGASFGRYTLRTLSDDGRRIFFTAPSAPSADAGALYMRLDHASTTQINGSERTPAGTASPARVETASTDGTIVFFTTAELLTNDTPDTNSRNLYMYDASLPADDPNNLTLISAGDGGSGSVSAVWGASEDGDYVYFTSLQQLVADAHTLEAEEAGVFLWHAGELTYIGALSAGQLDEQTGAMGTNFPTGRLSTRVTPDGRHLLFAAHGGSDLTGYDHNTTGCGSSGTEPCGELYLYDADLDSLVCASCNPTGAAATADASFNLGTGIGGSRVTSHLTRPLTDDGSRVFFTSGERLVPEDRNGRKLDVYEFDAGSGAIHLLSSGQSPDDSYFMDATPSGSDVFFVTRERLVGWDTNNGYDLYDARVNGGFPEPPAAVIECVGSACQGAAPAVPDARAPLSSSFVGGDDNVRPRQKAKARKRCRKGRVRKRVNGRVRCVRKRRATQSAHRSREAK
jgi:hypothetical protein